LGGISPLRMPRINTDSEPYLRGASWVQPPKCLKNNFRTVKYAMLCANICSHCDVTYSFATVFEAFEVPGKAIMACVYKMQENAWRPRLFPDPAEGSLQLAPLDLLAGWEGAREPPPAPQPLASPCLAPLPALPHQLGSPLPGCATPPRLAARTPKTPPRSGLFRPWASALHASPVPAPIFKPPS